MKWRTSKQKKMGVAWYQIEKELTVIDDISTEPVSYTHLTLPTTSRV